MTNGLLTGALRAQVFSNDGRSCRRSRPARFSFHRHAPGRAKWWWVIAREMALLALMVAVPLAAGAPQVVAPVPPLPGGTAFTIFLRGAPIGTEQMAVSRSAEGWTITSSGRLGAPLDVVGRRLQVRYTADWRPLAFSFDGTVRGQTQTVHTVVDGTMARSDIAVAGETKQKIDTIADDTLLVLPSSSFGPYEALAVRLR